MAVTRSELDPHSLCGPGKRIMPSHDLLLLANVSAISPRCCNAGMMAVRRRFGFSSTFFLFPRDRLVDGKLSSGGGVVGSGT